MSLWSLFLRMKPWDDLLLDRLLQVVLARSKKMEQRRKPNPESPMNASPSGTFLCANQELIAQSIVEMKRENNFSGPPLPPRSLIGCDPEAILSNLSSLEHRIHQVQDAVRTYMSSAELAGPNELVLRQQLVAADLTSIIVQLISAAGTLIPSLTAGGGVASPALPCPASSSPAVASSSRGQGGDPEDRAAEEEDLDDGDGDGENLAAGTYEVLQLEKEEILAPHTHFCVICGKGFKRDANLRMHMRGHGDEYKTLAALAKPCKDQSSDHGGGGVLRRYSCPFVGCKRNKEHKKFQPLKTILCVKNHYKRSHCAKSFTCSRCNRKKFSVIADLKTHEKHCGRDKWVCSCGTTFSRKDKLFGHVSLFQGHAPAIPFGEPKATPPPPPPESVAGGDMFEAKELETEVGPLSPFFNFDTFDFEGGGEFIQPALESPDGSFFFSSSSSSMLRIIPGGFPPPSAGTS